MEGSWGGGGASRTPENFRKFAKNILRVCKRALLKAVNFLLCLGMFSCNGGVSAPNARKIALLEGLI